MSPAKRLSRKRFRALCERCDEWTNTIHMPKRRCVKRWRAKRYHDALNAANVRAGAMCPWTDAAHVMHALARLAR